MITSGVYPLPTIRVHPTRVLFLSFSLFCSLSVYIKLISRDAARVGVVMVSVFGLVLAYCTSCQSINQCKHCKYSLEIQNRTEKGGFREGIGGALSRSYIPPDSDVCMCGCLHVFYIYVGCRPLQPNTMLYNKVKYRVS